MDAWNHPVLTHSSYNTLLLTWQEGGLKFFKALPPDGTGTILLDTYYLSYILSFFGAFFLIKRWQSRGQIRLAKSQTIDLFIVSFLGVFLGAKAVYILFYNLEFYIQNPAQIFLNWSGMASHGAIAGTLIGFYLYCRGKKPPILWHSLDYAAICACLGALFVRPANFLNAELFGREAPGWWPFKMRFPVTDGLGRPLFVSRDGEVFALERLGEVLGYYGASTEAPQRTFESFERVQSFLPHQIFSLAIESPEGPTQMVARLVTTPSHFSQIYEMLAVGVGLFAYLLWRRRRAFQDGDLALQFLMGYGGLRFLLEFFRQPDPQRSSGLFELLSMGQLLSLLLVLTSFFVWKKRRPAPKSA